MSEIVKVRRAYSGKAGIGGAIISVPASIRKEAGIFIEDYVSLACAGDGVVTVRKKEIEKFTEADVFPNGNDALLDDGYFTERGFHSTMIQKNCICKNREEHIKHLRIELETGS